MRYEKTARWRIYDVLQQDHRKKLKPMELAEGKYPKGNN
jgi:hypothetical protein